MYQVGQAVINDTQPIADTMDSAIVRLKKLLKPQQ